MGYRLDIYKVEHIYPAKKFYGYTTDETLRELKSFKYLISQEILDEDSSYFGYGFNHKIILDNRQFKEYIKLYNEDLNDFNIQSKDELINDKRIQQLIDSHEDKVLEWEG